MTLITLSSLFIGSLLLLALHGPLTAHHRQFSERDRASKVYEFLDKHHPQAIGKRYMGREIAGVMGYAGVTWLERPERSKEENLRLLLKSLGIKAAMHVADFGSGSGVLTLPVARLVGPKGRVFAIDIEKKMLARLKTKADQARLTNIDYVLASADNPRLKKNSVDLIFIVDVYHELEYPLEVIQKLKDALRPHGRLALIEYRAEDPKVPIKSLHKMSMAQIKRELLRPETGLELVESRNELPWQHLVFFQVTNTTK